LVGYPIQPARARRKKLADLGRYWAGGGRGKHLESDAAAWGITLEERQREAGNVDIWPEHVTAWNVFAACSTQWRIIAGPASLFQQGLEYTAVESVMRMHDVEDQGECLGQVQHIERGALAVLNKE
jgi:hypothetical protein